MQAKLLFNHVIRPQHQRRRDREAKGLGGLQVDDQLVLGRLLDRQISRAATLENSADIRASPLEHRLKIRTIRKKAPCLRKVPESASRRKARPCRQTRDLFSKRVQ